MDLVRMLTRVSRMVAYDFESNAAQQHMNRKKQVPSIVSMLTKDVYFTSKWRRKAPRAFNTDIDASEGARCPGLLTRS